MKSNRLFSFIVIMVLLISNIIYAEVPVRVIEPEVKEINNLRKVNSVIEPYQSIQISSKTGGIIDKINVQVGDYVKKGEPLFQFEQEDIRIQIKQAEAAVEIAEANYKMVQDGASKEDRATVEAAYQQALASYEGAKNSLELLESSYSDRTLQKQQLVAAETQLKAAEKQIKLAEEGLQQALTGLKQAEIEYERIKYLYDENVATKNQYEMVETQYKNAQSAVESARIAKEQADISYQGAKESYNLAESSYNKPEQLEQQLAASRTQLKIAEANKIIALANLEKVRKGAREEEVLISKASLKQAEAALEQARKVLADSIVKSPIDGIVAQVNFSVGEMTGPGTPVLNIVNLDRVYIKANITEDLVSNLNKGQKVKARLLASENIYLEGNIEYIAPVVDPRTQAFPVKVLVENTAGKLRGGMFTELYLPVASTKEALVIPISAVFDVEKNPYIYVIKEGKAVKTSVETGIISGDYIEIISGIEQGQNVVIRGQSNLEDSMLVEVIK